MNRPTIAAALMMLTSCSAIHTMWDAYPSDNILENTVEDVIAAQTGAKIDLTPFSPEDDDRWEHFK